MLIACLPLWLAAPCLGASIPQQLPIAETREGHDGVTHAIHIFNALHNSMKQFGSVLQHNGMSFMLATVPQDVEFYHGSGSPDPVEGMQWLAFEPEHAMAFARPRRVRDHGEANASHAGSSAESSYPGHSEHPGWKFWRTWWSRANNDQVCAPIQDENNQSFEQDRRPEKLEDERDRGLDFRNGPERPQVHSPSKSNQEDGVRFGLTESEADAQVRRNNRHELRDEHRSSQTGRDSSAKHRDAEKDSRHARMEIESHRDILQEDAASAGSQRARHDDHDEKSNIHRKGKAQMGEEQAEDKRMPGKGPGNQQDLLASHSDVTADLYDEGEEQKPQRSKQSHKGSAKSQHKKGKGKKKHHTTTKGDRKKDQHSAARPTQKLASSDSHVKASGEVDYGYLHTYRTKHALKLLYLDGQSAAKSIKGTLDTQDIVLRNASEFAGSPIEGDRLRGQELCKVAADEWGNKIDGFLRMVGGFEIILCSFKDHLDVVNIAAKLPQRGDSKDETGLSYAQALSKRFQGIGGERVSINYESDFLTAFAFPEAVYINEEGLPRIYNDSQKLSKLRGYLYHLIVEQGFTSSGTNWQAVVDQIVTRYSYRIEYMLSGSITTFHELRRQAHLALGPFIDDSHRNGTLEAARCAAQFLPNEADSSSVPAQAVRTVADRICTSLVSTMYAGDYDEGIAVTQKLRKYLDWTSFKERECAGCAVDEVCQLPIWPSGSKRDFEQPKCGRAMEHGAGGYWDMMGRKRGQH